MATPKEIAKLWSVLCAAYPSYGRDFDEGVMDATIKIYQKLLADIPADVLGVAAEQHIASSKWFPAVSELREIANKLTAPVLAERTPDEAWGEVKRVVGTYYPYWDKVVCDPITDPIAAQVVKDMGGVQYLYYSTNEVSDRKQFLDAYRVRQERARESTSLLPAARQMKELAAQEKQQVLELPAPRGALNESEQDAVESVGQRVDRWIAKMTGRKAA